MSTKSVQQRKTKKPKKNDNVILLRKMPTGGSDAALKTGIVPLQGALNKILALRPVSWQWKSEDSSQAPQYGFIAQEVEQHIPELVSEGIWKDGSTKRFLSTNDMFPYLVVAIQDQQKEIERLKKLLSDRS